MEVARVFGAGAVFKAKDPALQPQVNAFTADPVTDLPTTLPRMLTELQVFGELVLPINVTPISATVRLGYLDPGDVETVLFRIADKKSAVAVIQRRPTTGDEKLIWLVAHPDPRYDNRFAPHPVLGEDKRRPGLHGPLVKGLDGNPVELPVGPDGEIVPELRELVREGSGYRVAGYCFYERANCLVSGRGRSLYERIGSYLKAQEDWFFGMIRNAILQQSFIFHYQVDSNDPDEIEAEEERVAKNRPRNGAWFVTGPRDKLTPVTADVPAAGGIRELFTGLLKIMGIARAIPGHELGAEDDTNRSTAQESRTTSVNRAKLFQKQIAAMMCRWIAYQLDQLDYTGQLLYTDSAKPDRTVECVLPELDARDEKEVSDSVNTRVQAMSQALDAGLVLEKDAVTFVYQAMGLEVPDWEKFKTQRDQEREDRDERTVGDLNDAAKAALAKAGLGNKQPGEPGEKGQP